MATWKPLPGILDPISIREFKGVNKLDAFSISEQYATYINNFTSSGYPTLTVRQGTSNLGTSLGAGVVGLSSWKDTELHAIANGNWVKWTGSAWGSNLLTGIDTAKQWSFCNFQGDLTGINLIGVNGAMSKKYDGTSVTDLTGIPAGCTLIDEHDNRLYAVNGNTIYFSGLKKAQDWTSTDQYVGAGSVVVETTDGKPITAIRSGPGHLVVYKSNYTYELWGTGPYNFQTQLISNKVGCDANLTSVMVGGTLYSKSVNGIYQYKGGTIPSKDFSRPVQWYIDNINATYANKCCAGTDGKRYYLAIPLLTATDPSHVLEYDPLFDTWYVWQLGHYPWAFTNVGNNWYNGDSTGQVHQMNSGTTDAGTAISWQWDSKIFGEGSLAQKKEWYDAWIVCTLPTGSTLNMYLTPDATGDASWTLVNTVTPKALAQGVRMIIPVNTIANANWARVRFTGTGPCTINELARQERLLPYI